MLTKVTSSGNAISKTYAELFGNLENISEGGYKTYHQEQAILPEGFKANTLVLAAENDKGDSEEIVVDYAGNELIVSNKQRENHSPQLLKHLEMIGRAMFSPDSQKNLVINSDKSKII